MVTTNSESQTPEETSTRKNPERGKKSSSDRRGERLQKIISASGLASRRKAEELIVQGRVQVNGHTVTELGTRADPQRDRISVDGKPLPRPSRQRYILLNKPRGVLSSLADKKGRPLVTDLLKGVRDRVYPVGRLDLQSEGLLLLTNDGAFANAVGHPSGGVPRIYRVKVRGVPTEAEIARIRDGKISLDGQRIRPRSLERAGGLKNPWYRIVLNEGRNREVRRLFEAIGYSVVRLKRIGIGGLRIGTLRVGQWRELSRKEVAALLKRAESGPSRSRQGRREGP